MPAQAGHDPVHQQLLAVTSRGKLSWEETDTRRMLCGLLLDLLGGTAGSGLPLGAGQENALEDEQGWYSLSTHVFARGTSEQVLGGESTHRD